LPDYNFYNKSRLATGQGHGKLAHLAAPLITQFKQFGLHMYGVQGNLIAEAIRNSSGEARREAWKTLAYLQGSHALMYGGIGASVFGSLPAMVTMGLYDYASGDDRPHTNAEVRNASRNWVFDQTQSKTLADMFDRGVPMAMGLDVSRSLKFTNLVGIPELQAFNSKAYLEFFTELVTGAAGGTVSGLIDAGSAIRKGDISKENIFKLMPRALEDPLTAAFVYPSEGLRATKGGRTIVPAEKFSTFDLVAKAAGFNPGVVSTGREARGAIDLEQKVVEDAHNNILSRLVRAKGAERKPILAEITRYNSRVPPHDRITGQQIQSRLRDQARINAQPGFYGMEVPKRDTRAMRELTRSLQP